MSKFPLPSPSKTFALPFDFAIERDPKNIFYFQRDVENYTDQVLNFLLFDRHEYIHKNLHSFKEGLILLHQSILERRRISHLHGSAHFTIPLNCLKKCIFLELCPKSSTKSKSINPLNASVALI